MRPLVVAVVGTGTGIGKTHVGAALLREAARRGLVSAGRKPIESGVTAWEASDAGILDSSGSLPADRRPPYLFTDPVSPHLASRRAGVSVDVALAAAWARESSAGADLLVVETAGALLSPIGTSTSGPRTNLDLVLAIAPDALLLVAPDRLGVLHEVSAARVILPTHLWTRAAVTLVTPASADASTGTNAEELAVLGVVVGVASAVTGWPRDPGGAGPAAALLDQLVVLAG